MSGCHGKNYLKLGENIKKDDDELDLSRPDGKSLIKGINLKHAAKYRLDHGIDYAPSTSGMKSSDPDENTDSHSSAEADKFTHSKTFAASKMKQSISGVDRPGNFIFNSKDGNNFPLFSMEEDSKKVGLMYASLTNRKFEGSPLNSGYESGSSQNDALCHMPLETATPQTNDYMLSLAAGNDNPRPAKPNCQSDYSNRGRQKCYECSLCSFTSRKQIDLINHVAIHPDEKPFHCPHCDYKGSKFHYLRNHLLSHSEQPVHQCPQCDYKCVQRGSLKVHMRRHSDEKKYACTLCHYRSHFKGNLKLHIRVHTGEKPYACTECEFRCTQSGSLKIHMRGHSGEKPYACEMCDYRSKHKGNLVMHRRKHTGDKPYQCDRCNYKSSQKMALNKHIKSVHVNQVTQEDNLHPHHHLLDTSERDTGPRENPTLPVPADYSMLHSHLRLNQDLAHGFAESFAKEANLGDKPLSILGYKLERDEPNSGRETDDSEMLDDGSPEDQKVVMPDPLHFPPIVHSILPPSTE